MSPRIHVLSMRLADKERKLLAPCRCSKPNAEMKTFSILG